MGSAQTNVINQKFTLGFIDCLVIKIEWKVDLAKRLILKKNYDWFIDLLVESVVYRFKRWFNK